MIRKSPTRPKNLHAVLNLEEEYAVILQLRKRIEAATSPRVSAGRPPSQFIDDDPLSSKKARQRN